MSDHTPVESFHSSVTYLSKEERQRVRQALELAQREHGHQRRKSGEPFYTHPLAVASYLAQFHLDADTLMAALLHDVAEDTSVSVEEIQAQFGPEVGHLVNGVTKLKDVSQLANSEALTVEEIRDASLTKLFYAMTADVRVVVIKLFDRLHNMRTITALPHEKQRQKAEETLAVFAPLANRLGMWQLKNELETLSLQVLNADAHHTIRHQLEHLRHEQQPAFAAASQQVVDRLLANKIPLRDVLYCPENIYSTYQALIASAKPLHNIDKVLRLVVLLEDTAACYLALGAIHGLWRPVPGHFDDYIAAPRDNLYRALHTTVIDKSGRPLKIRFRSVAMNEISEIGVLARWVYAGTPLWTKGIARRVDALFASISEDISQDSEKPGAAVRVVEDLSRTQIMVYTPRGDIVELPQGATAVDFAYYIHSEVGNHCRAARVNERSFALNGALSDGDRVQVLTTERAIPQRTWLDEDLGYMTTSRARSRARRWFRRLSRQEAIQQGEKLLSDELELLGLAEDYPHKSVTALLGLPTVTELYYLLGRAELLPTAVATRVLDADWDHQPLQSTGSRVQSAEGEEFVITNIGGRRLRLCQACQARPGDAIVGLIRSDGSVTVHQEGCHKLPADPLSDRILKLGWGAGTTGQVRVVRLRIDVFDRAGLIFEITKVVDDEALNIKSINTPDSGPTKGKTEITIHLEVTSPRQLVRILHRIHALVNVYSVRCLLLQS